MGDGEFGRDRDDWDDLREEFIRRGLIQPWFAVEKPEERAGWVDLRFRADAPSVVSDGDSVLDDTLRQLSAEEIPGARVVRDRDGKPRGVLVSTDMYLSMAAMAMKQPDLLQVERPRGRAPREEVFVWTMTEQVNPNQPWGGPGNPVGPNPRYQSENDLSSGD